MRKFNIEVDIPDGIYCQGCEYLIEIKGLCSYNMSYCRLFGRPIGYCTKLIYKKCNECNQLSNNTLYSECDECEDCINGICTREQED